MHILTGLYNATSGTAKIDGLDIHQSINEIRHKIGFAPQYNILFTGMTVREHLWFYSNLKSIEKSEDSINSSINRILDETELLEFEDERVERLSGGMQRKLSVAIAFVGDSKIVILDEPSAGVDPSGRRSIWDVLLKYKQDRTIVISTHHMDEAEILSDRVVIISEGKLIAHASPKYLKKKFGQGYYLTICKNSHALSQETEQQDAEINKFVLDRFGTAVLIENNFSEITYSISNDAQYTKSYAQNFKEIEDFSNLLGISSVKLTDTNLEEIFLKLTEEAKLTSNSSIDSSGNKKVRFSLSGDDGECKKSTNRVLDFLNRKLEKHFVKTTKINTQLSSTNSSDSLKAFSDYTKLRVESNLEAVSQQFYALIAKRYHRVKRNTQGLLAETVLPLSFVCLALLFSNFTPNLLHKPSLELHPWHYSKSNMLFMSYKNPENETNVWSSLLKAPGPGARCLKNYSIYVDKERLACESYNYKPINKRSSFSRLDKRLPFNKSVQCYKMTKLNDCENKAYADLQQFKIKTKDILFNLTGRNVSDWILETEFSHKFFKKRYGGFEFDLYLESQKYFEIIESSAPKILKTLDQMSAMVHQKSEKDVFAKYMEIFDKGSLLTRKSIKIWYNPKGFHSNVAYLNHMNNILLRAKLAEMRRFNKTMNHSSTDIDISEHGIIAHSHPITLSKWIPIDMLKKR